MSKRKIHLPPETKIPAKEWTWNIGPNQFSGVNTNGNKLNWFTHHGATEQSLNDFLKNGPVLEDIPKVVVEQLQALLQKAADATNPQLVQEKVRQINQREYQLPCTVCGVTAVTFQFHDLPAGDGLELAYTGIAHSTTRKLPTAYLLIKELRDQNLVAIHQYLKEKAQMEDGMDGYCPDCGKIYCRPHYNVVDEWDEGYFDCAYGTCPEGHRRIIDD